MYCSQHLGASSRTLAVTLGVWILRAPSLASLYDRPDIQWRDHRERVSEILFEDSAKKSASKRPPVFKCMHLYQNFLGDLWLWLCRCGRHLLRSRRPVHRALLFFWVGKDRGKNSPTQLNSFGHPTTRERFSPPFKRMLNKNCAWQQIFWSVVHPFKH